MKTRARQTGLVVRELEGELLVYDLEAHRAHRLNRAAAIVFHGCDGRTGVPELAARLRRELGVPADGRWVRLAIARLSKAGLLEEAAESAATVSRRDWIRRAGLTLLLPTVISIVAPTPAEAAATCVTACAGKAFGTPCRNTGPASDCGTVCVCDGSGNCVLASDGATPCP
jgi:hypothetical protein